MKFVITRHSERSVQVQKLWQQVLLLQGDIQSGPKVGIHYIVSTFFVLYLSILPSFTTPVKKIITVYILLAHLYNFKFRLVGIQDLQCRL